MASSTVSMPMPDLAEISRASEASRPITSSICCDALGLGGGEIDLVEDGDDFVVGVERLVDIGEGLRLDALGGVDDQQRTLAGGERARDFVGEVDMAGGVDEVEDIVLAVLGAVVQADGLRLDGDAALALDIHRIEHLLLHLARFEPAGGLDQPVGERRLAMVDMGDDGEIADVGDGKDMGRRFTGDVCFDKLRAARRGKAGRRTRGANATEES